MSEFRDKVVLVTGSGGGIGKAIATRFASFGAKLVLVDINGEWLEQACRDIEQQSSQRPLIVVGDLTDDKFCEQLIEKTIDHFKRLDVLVNNAGIFRPGPFMSRNQMENFDKVMNLNIRAAVKMCHVAAPHLVANKGNIINISSVASFTIYTGNLGYFVSKAALTKLTQLLASELGTKGVRVNEVWYRNIN